MRSRGPAAVEQAQLLYPYEALHALHALQRMACVLPCWLAHWAIGNGCSCARKRVDVRQPCCSRPSQRSMCLEGGTVAEGV